MKLTLNKILFAVILLLLSVVGFQQCSLDKQSDQISQKNNIIEVVTDSMRVYKDQGNTFRYEKKTFQASIYELKKQNQVLSDNQKRLVKQLDHKTKAAAQIKEVVILKNITNSAPIANPDSSLTFTHQSDSINYAITVKNTSMTIDSMSFPNHKSVNFQTTKSGTILRVKNSNPYFKTADIDSYMVPVKKPKNYGYKAAILVLLGALILK